MKEFTSSADPRFDAVADGVIEELKLHTERVFDSETGVLRASGSRTTNVIHAAARKLSGDDLRLLVCTVRPNQPDIMKQALEALYVAPERYTPEMMVDSAAAAALLIVIAGRVVPIPRRTMPA